jgi:hypothetical protein
MFRPAIPKTVHNFSSEQRASLQDRPKDSPPEQTEQNEQQKIPADRPVVAAGDVAPVPVEAEEKPEDHNYPE